MSSISRNLPVSGWHRQMQAHVALGVSLLVALSLGIALFATTRVITARAMVVASDDLDAARTAFYHLAENRAEFAAAQSRLITTLPVFRAHMTDPRLVADAATLDAMAEGYRQQLEADFLVVTSPTGVWTGRSGWLADQAPPEAVRASIDRALAGGAHQDVVAIRNELFLVVSQPAVFAEEVLGSVTVGYALDDAVARELADVTQCEVTLIAGDRISGSSLGARARTQLSGQLAARASQTQPGVGAAVHLSDAEYVAGAYPLSRGALADSEGRLLLLEDWGPTQRFLDDLRGQLLRGGLVILAFALAGGLLFSRRISRPLTDIAAAAEDMAQGNWARQVPVRGSAEAKTMGMAFNAMGTNLHRAYADATDKSERLQALYDRFHAVTESARDAIVSTDRRGSITFWNRSATTIFGYLEGEAIDHAFPRFIAEPHRQRFLDALTALQAAQDPQALGRTIEVTAVRKGGAAFPAEVSLSAWQSGGVTSMTAVVRDITERKHADAQRLRHHEEIESQRLRVFRATMTTVHDIVNNFLASMQLIRMEVEEQLPGETLELFDRLIDGTASELKVLGDLQTIRETEMAVGTGIEYRSPAA